MPLKLGVNPSIAEKLNVQGTLRMPRQTYRMKLAISNMDKYNKFFCNELILPKEIRLTQGISLNFTIVSFQSDYYKGQE